MNNLIQFIGAFLLLFGVGRLVIALLSREGENFYPCVIIAAIGLMILL